MTAWHPTDEDLILQFYGELPPALARQVEAHLASCELCRAAWADLGEVLALARTAAVPEPPASFEAVMWARVSRALPAERGRWWLPLVPIGAIATLVVAVAALSGVSRPDAATGAAARRERAAQLRTEQGVLLAALDDHFAQTELLLVELLNAPAEDGLDLPVERAVADDLVASGRLYRVTAHATGEAQFATMLEDLESVLIDVARSPAPLARTAFESIRERIDEGDLLFKVRAAASEVRVRQYNLTTASEGPL
jgi:anti-sigma factor RsiW